MTVEWMKYAQSLTNRPMKAMLTGPVTMLQWSFVRDDQPQATGTASQTLSVTSDDPNHSSKSIHVIGVGK